MHTRRLRVLWVIIFLLSGCSVFPADRPSEVGFESSGFSTLEERIRAVENGLLKVYATGKPALGNTYTLEERMRDYGVPGVGIAVIEEFQIDWAAGYGVRVAGGDDPVTSETLFHAGSVSKMVAAAGALRLAEEGALDLDQDLNDFLVSWQIPENEFTAVEKVTLRRLLSHSAGIRDGFTDRSGEDVESLPNYLAPGGEAPSAAILDLLEGAPGLDIDGSTRVAAIPGSEYRYANADYAILELLLSDVTGTPLPQFMTERVLEPLGMLSSTFEMPLPSELRARAVWEHYAGGEPFERERLHFPFTNMWTTPSDLARFAIEIIQAYNGRSSRLLTPGLAAEMLTAQVAIKGNPLANAYGFGFDLQTNGEVLIAFHTGATWGSTCLLWLYPQTGQGAVVMTNSADGGMIRFEILYSIAQAYGWP